MPLRSQVATAFPLASMPSWVSLSHSRRSRGRSRRQPRRRAGVERRRLDQTAVVERPAPQWRAPSHHRRTRSAARSGRHAPAGRCREAASSRRRGSGRGRRGRPRRRGRRRRGMGTSCAAPEIDRGRQATPRPRPGAPPRTRGIVTRGRRGKRAAAARTPWASPTRGPRPSRRRPRSRRRSSSRRGRAPAPPPRRARPPLMPSAIRTPTRPEMMYWKCGASHSSVPAMGLMCSDQRQPGSMNSRPTSPPPILTIFSSSVRELSHLIRGVEALLLPTGHRRLSSREGPCGAMVSPPPTAQSTTVSLVNPARG